MATAMSPTAFMQLSLNANGVIEFCREVSELVEPRRVFAQSRRQRTRQEIHRNVVLAEKRRAYVRSFKSTFDCRSPLAYAMKTLVVGAEAVAAASSSADAAAMPRDVVRRICYYV